MRVNIFVLLLSGGSAFAWLPWWSGLRKCTRSTRGGGRTKCPSCSCSSPTSFPPSSNCSACWKTTTPERSSACNWLGEDDFSLCEIFIYKFNPLIMRRIMVLNLLNLYSLIPALFGKISKMVKLEPQAPKISNFWKLETFKGCKF